MDAKSVRASKIARCAGLVNISVARIGLVSPDFSITFRPVPPLALHSVDQSDRARTALPLFQPPQSIHQGPLEADGKAGVLNVCNEVFIVKEESQTPQPIIATDRKQAISCRSI